MSFGFVNFGVKELILILVIVLVIFGPKKLPEIGKSFGEMLAGFRSGSKDQTEEETGDSGKSGDQTGESGPEQK